MTRTLLLADDSPTIRRIVELAFSGSQFKVDTVGDGAQALRYLEARRPALVLADVAMPAPAGYELCRRIKDSEHPVPVVLLAGTFEPFDVDQAAACGADDHLVKPFESRTLVEKVRRLLPNEGSGESMPHPEAGASAVAEAARPAAVEAARGADELDALARELLRRMSVELVREVAREVALELIPQVAERVVRERIRELEQEDA